MDSAVRTTDPVEAVTNLLRTAEEQALLGEQARANLHAQTAAGHAGEAWAYEDLAEACEEAVTELVAEATALYRSLEEPLRKQADDRLCDCRYARCLHS